jgi:hypothetical protein
VAILANNLRLSFLVQRFSFLDLRLTAQNDKRETTNEERETVTPFQLFLLPAKVAGLEARN